VSQEVPESPHSAAIRRRMAQVRRGLDEDVQDIVDVARDMAEWRYFVKTFPWLCLGTAVVGGYLLVPRKRVSTQLRRVVREQQARNGAARDQVADSPPPNRTSEFSSFRGTALRFAGNLLMRTALTHAARQVDKLLAPSPLDPAGRSKSHERIHETTR